MALTEEQRKRIEENRKRALEIRQLEKKEENTTSSVFDEGGFVQDNKKRKIEDNVAVGGGKNGDSDYKKEGVKQSVSDSEESLEDFELNASQYISQTDAQRLYCVPKGTLDVCTFIEKDNPHNKGFSKMKLYVRKDVRKRAHKRFKGKNGLIVEREKRRKKRSAKDLEESKNIFG
jgi:hypothetical protein